MDKIKWCLNQKKGIMLLESSDNLRDAHIIKAEDALDAVITSKSRDWKLTAAYYTIYHGIYSLLMKIGVKCEVHSCTIEFAKTFLKEYFSNEDFELIDKSFSARIDSQYYVNREVSDQNYETIMKKTPAFLVKCKNANLEQRKIDNIRNQISSLNR